jgi:hypothetical protein
LDARLPHVKKTKKRKKRHLKDRHGWNSLESYNAAYHGHLDNHPFIDYTYPLPEVQLIASESNKNVYAVLNGSIHCKNNVLLEIRKIFHTRILTNGITKIRCFSFCYHANIVGGRKLVRYDNQDRISDYHKHTFDQYGNEISRTSMSRQQFPILHEIIDELEKMFP